MRGCGIVVRSRWLEMHELWFSSFLSVLPSPFSYFYQNAKILLPGKSRRSEGGLWSSDNCFQDGNQRRPPRLGQYCHRRRGNHFPADSSASRCVLAGILLGPWIRTRQVTVDHFLSLCVFNAERIHDFFSLFLEVPTEGSGHNSNVSTYKYRCLNTFNEASLIYCIIFNFMLIVF